MTLRWKIEFSDNALEELERLDRTVQKRIRNFIRNRIEPSEDPRSFGVALQGDLGGFWRYRVGSYRIICEIIDNRVVVRVVSVGHRRNVYDQRRR